MTNQPDKDQAPPKESQPKKVIDFTLKPRPLRKVYEEIFPQGQPIKAEDLLNQELTVHHMKPFSGKFGRALYCVITLEGGEIRNTIIGAVAVIEKLWTCRDNLPVTFTLVQRDGGEFGRYYDIE